MRREKRSCAICDEGLAAQFVDGSQHGAVLLTPARGIWSACDSSDLLAALIARNPIAVGARFPSLFRSCPPLAESHSARRAFMTSVRAARTAGARDAMTAAVSSTNAERTTGKAPGIFTSRK